MVDGSGTESEEEIRQAVLEELKPNGLVNDDPEIYGAMDTELSGSSAVIPVALKADGSLKATSKTASTEEFGTMSDYVKETVTKAGRRILGGDVAAAPYELDGRSGCDYCPYHMVCGFDARIPGFSYRKLEKPGRCRGDPCENERDAKRGEETVDGCFMDQRTTTGNRFKKAQHSGIGSCRFG